jgi:hypothetical protein
MFFERHDVRHHLAGMGAARQPVDDRHGGVRGELQQRIMVENPDHDDVDITRQHARGVGDGLATAELHFGARQHDRFAAELAHADVERYPRTRRGLFENHRERLVLQRFVGFFPAALLRLQLGLHGNARGKHLPQLRKRKLVEVEKVT